jgi:hypothetical protein
VAVCHDAINAHGVFNTSGRPTHYTAAIVDHILYELSGGRILRDVCRDDGMPPHNTVRGWVVDDREDSRHATSALGR